MRRTKFLAALLALGLLAGCGRQIQPPAEPSSSRAEEPPAQTFLHGDDFYTDLATSMDVVMLPLFASVEQMTAEQQAQYFPYFVQREQLGHGGQDWWDEEDQVYRIPVEIIGETLRTYLGVENFDPAAAFGTETRCPGYAKVPLGYDREHQEWVVCFLSGWGGGRNSHLVEKTLDGDGKVTVTVGFYDMESHTDPYKKKVISLREDPEDLHRYTLLSVVEYQKISGSEVLVTGDRKDQPSKAAAAYQALAEDLAEQYRAGTAEEKGFPAAPAEFVFPEELPELDFQQSGSGYFTARIVSQDRHWVLRLTVDDPGYESGLPGEAPHIDTVTFQKQGK